MPGDRTKDFEELKCLVRSVGSRLFDAIVTLEFREPWCRILSNLLPVNPIHSSP